MSASTPSETPFSSSRACKQRQARHSPPRRQVMRVPEDWRECSSYNQCIDRTRILPVKTPLKENFNAKIPASEMKEDTLGVPIEEEFTPNDFMESLKQKGLVLGLVIDLTNTFRYYNGEEFESANVQYEKVKCEGHVIPADNVYYEFSKTLHSFLSKNKTKIVAVHCTHGINRTGYLVCRYLVEYCDYKVEEAIKAFESARGEEIERKNYLGHLRKGCPKMSASSKSWRSYSKSSDNREGHVQSWRDSHSSERGQPHYTRQDKDRHFVTTRVTAGQYHNGDSHQFSDKDSYQRVHRDTWSFSNKDLQEHPHRDSRQFFDRDSYQCGRKDSKKFSDNNSYSRQFSDRESYEHPHSKLRQFSEKDSYQHVHRDTPPISDRDSYERPHSKSRRFSEKNWYQHVHRDTPQFSDRDLQERPHRDLHQFSDKDSYQHGHVDSCQLSDRDSYQWDHTDSYVVSDSRDTHQYGPHRHSHLYHTDIHKFSNREFCNVDDSCETQTNGHSCTIAQSRSSHKKKQHGISR